MNIWLIKSEPFKYSWTQFLADKWCLWDGVRNYQARNYLREMKLGDLAFFYHSNEGKSIVGIAKVAKEAYQDPTAPQEDWSVVEFVPYAELSNPVSLATLRADEILKNMAIFRQMRLSVVAVSQQEYEQIIHLGSPKLLTL